MWLGSYFKFFSESTTSNASLPPSLPIDFETEQRFEYRSEHSSRHILTEKYFRKRIQSQLQCHSFDWYLEHVMKELYVPEDHFTIKGQIKSKLKRTVHDSSS